MQSNQKLITKSKFLLGATEHVGLTLNEPGNIMWSLGQANRLSSEFKYSDQPRNYQWEWATPTENTFTIGTSNEKEDWYIKI